MKKQEIIIEQKSIKIEQDHESETNDNIDVMDIEEFKIETLEKTECEISTNVIKPIFEIISHKSENNFNENLSENIAKPQFSPKVLNQILKEFSIIIDGKKCYNCQSSFNENTYHFCSNSLDYYHENSEYEKFKDSELKNEILHKRSNRHNRDEIEKRKKIQHGEKENVIKFARKRSRPRKFDDNSKDMVQAKKNTEIGKLKRPKIHRINNFFVLGSLLSN